MTNPEQPIEWIYSDKIRFWPSRIHDNDDPAGVLAECDYEFLKFPTTLPEPTK